MTAGQPAAIPQPHTRPGAAPAIVRNAERWLVRLIEAAAALIVLAEIVILSAGVLFRFVLHRPLVWSDELASFLFLWLAMLGSVIALHRQQHMRLTAVLGLVSPRAQAVLQALALGAAVLFLLLILPHATDYAADQWWIETPALGWTDMARTGALPAGFGIMALLCALQLARLPWRDVAIAVSVLLALGVLMYAGGPALRAVGNWNLVVFFVGLLMLCVLSGVPIGFSFGLATFAYLATTTSVPLSVVVSRMDEGMSSLILLAVPLFVLLGALIEMTGMAAAMVGFLVALLGHVRGGLNFVLLGAMYLISGISGSKAADMAAVAPVLFPEMKRRGINEGEMVSLLSASGAMSETIPPSIVLIAIGSTTGVSIAALFTGGLVPALVLALALAAIAWHRSRDVPAATGGRASLRTIGATLLIAMPALILPVVIRAFVIEGVTTATEVSTIGIAYSVMAGLLVYRQFDWRRVYPILVETASLSGAILFIIGAATCMAWALTQSGFSHGLASAMEAIPGGSFGFLAVSIVAFIVLGSVLEGIPAIVLFGPLLFPIARAVGIHEVHYAMVAVLAMGLGLFAPPFGVGYYAACAIGRVSPDAGMRRIWPYLGALLAGLVLVAAIPWLSTGFL